MADGNEVAAVRPKSNWTGRKRDRNKNACTIKMPLKSILQQFPNADREQVEHFENVITQFFFERSKMMAKIASLASLLLLYRVNTAIDENNRGYFDQKGEKVVENCFNGVLASNIADESKMPADFRAMAEQLWIEAGEFVEWPEKAILGNGFGYFHQQFGINMKTTLTTHHKTRLTYYLRMKCHQMNSFVGWRSFDNIDIRNAIKAVTKLEDWSGDDEIRRDKLYFLWNALIELGLPADKTITEAVHDNIQWFQSIWLFARMQREIESFLLCDEYAAFNQQWQAYKDDPVNKQQPPLQRPARIRNFTVVPISRYQLQHVRFDKRDMYNLASKTNSLPKMKNPETERQNKQPESYYRNGNESELWELIFDINKIHRMGKDKKNFNFQFVTDSVSVSLMYMKTSTTQLDPDAVDESLRNEYDQGYFEYEAGIDPGDKTWMAVMRRHIETGTEVSALIIVVFEKSFFCFELCSCNRMFVLAIGKHQNWESTIPLGHETTAKKQKNGSIGGEFRRNRKGGLCTASSGIRIHAIATWCPLAFIHRKPFEIATSWIGGVCDTAICAA